MNDFPEPVRLMYLDMICGCRGFRQMPKGTNYGPDKKMPNGSPKNLQGEKCRPLFSLSNAGWGVIQGGGSPPGREHARHPGCSRICQYNNRQGRLDSVCGSMALEQIGTLNVDFAIAQNHISP